MPADVTPLTVVAHRGVTDRAPGNTLPAFERAIGLGADAVELDVRLTRDAVPVVFHHYYLDGVTSLSGPLFAHTLGELRASRVRGSDGATAGQRRAPVRTTEPPTGPPAETGETGEAGWQIPTLEQVLEALGGRIGLEVEVKGPEPEAATVVAEVLGRHRHLWETMAVPSYEPALLRDVGRQCPGLPTDLLLRRPPEWMRLDVVAYEAAQPGRLARARAVHPHPSQLTPTVVETVRSHGLDIHAWEVDDAATLHHVTGPGIRRVCTDRLQTIRNARRVGKEAQRL